MPLPKRDPKIIEQYIKNASLQIIVNGKFIGTGFFISHHGYVLTAYHCIGDGSGEIQVKTPFDGLISAELERDKSLSDDDLDLAILKTDYQPSHYLPLGLVNRDNLSDSVIAVGYPASNLPNNQEVGVYEGNISRWRDDDRVELSGVIKGKGHSGSSVYHPASGRVIGVVTCRHRESVMVDTGLATRLDKLFEKWTELGDLNQATIQVWEKRLQSLTSSNLKHRIVFAMVPDDSEYQVLLKALREVVEGQWGCQLLTDKDKQYGDSTLENIRCHMEQSHIFIAEVSKTDPEVMFVLGAVQFYLSHVPSVMLAQDKPFLPKSLQGRIVIRYKNEGSEQLITSLDIELGRIESIKQILSDPHREHYLPVGKLQAITIPRLSLPDRTWEMIQERYPTQEAWQQVSINALQSLLGKDADLASVILRRVQKVAS
jgi:Trypsin-like peptidase domain